MAACVLLRSWQRRTPTPTWSTKAPRSVSIVDTETETVSATIKVGERPRGLAVSAGRRKSLCEPRGRDAHRARHVREGGERARDARPPAEFDRREPRRQVAGGGDRERRRGRAARSRDDACREEDTGSWRQACKQRCLQPGRAVDIRQRGGQPRGRRYRRQARRRRELDPRGSAVARHCVPSGGLARLCRGRAGQRGGRDRCRGARQSLRGSRRQARPSA